MRMAVRFPGGTMANPLEGVDTSDAPYVIVSSDTHAGLYVEDYRPYLESSVHAEFDEWLTTRHHHRAMVEELNGEYVEQWERENAEGLKGAYDPAIRDKTLDADDLEFTLAVADNVALPLKNVETKQELSENLTQTRSEVRQLRQQLGVESELIGSSPQIMQVQKEIARAAP